MQLKLFVIHVPVGVMIVSLILFSQAFTALAVASSSSDQTDKELKDKDTKQKSKSSDTKPNDGDNMGKQTEEEQESNSDTRAIGLEQNITIENIHPSNDMPFELPFDNSLPFP
jgi:hypothetical protein